MLPAAVVMPVEAEYVLPLPPARAPLLPFRMARELEGEAGMPSFVAAPITGEPYPPATRALGPPARPIGEGGYGFCEFCCCCCSCRGDAIDWPPNEDEDEVPAKLLLDSSASSRCVSLPLPPAAPPPAPSEGEDDGCCCEGIAMAAMLFRGRLVAPILMPPMPLSELLLLLWLSLAPPLKLGTTLLLLLMLLLLLLLPVPPPPMKSSDPPPPPLLIAHWKVAPPPTPARAAEAAAAKAAAGSGGAPSSVGSAGKSKNEADRVVNMEGPAELPP